MGWREHTSVFVPEISLSPEMIEELRRNPAKLANGWQPPDLDANLRQPLPLDDEVLIDDTPDAEAEMLKSKHAVTMSRLHRQRTTLQAMVVDARNVYEGSLKELWDCERMLREAGEI